WGVDSELTLVALRRASELMRTLAGGVVAAGFADAYPNRPAPKVIDLKVSEVRRLLGIALSAEEIARILCSLGFGCEMREAAAVVRTSVPSYRLDVSIPADLVEEVARVYGYDRLPTTLIAEEMPQQERFLDLELEERVRDALVGCGLTEVITYSLTNLESVARLTPNGAAPDPEGYLRLANPLTREHEYLRQTLMNTTLETVARNLRFVDRVAIFEIASVYLPKEGQELAEEPRRLSIALTGPRDVRSWLTNDSPAMDLYDLKGIVEALCERLGAEGVGLAPIEHPTFHPGRVAGLSLNGDPIGVLGEVHPLVRASYDLSDRAVYLLELDLEKLLAAARPLQRFRPISRMPVLKIDLAVVVDEAVPADAVASAIRASGGALLVDLVLFDVYRGAQLGAGKKNLAYSLTFQSRDKTLTTEQITRQRDRIVQALEKEHGAQIRA
ncbi:MAG: phenylalanine--tRNA ligase subunit beta, partial [Chloroflexi bacterium]|nr:phenylalanine--tRNA ligase subunit beta [Chloroflexota bacterium]